MPNDAPLGPAPDRIVKRSRGGDCRCLKTLWHDPMAALLAESDESVLFKNPTNLRARKNPESTQRHLNLGDKNLVVKGAADFGRRG